MIKILMDFSIIKYNKKPIQDFILTLTQQELEENVKTFASSMKSEIELILKKKFPRYQFDVNESVNVLKVDSEEMITEQTKDTKNTNVQVKDIKQLKETKLKKKKSSKLPKINIT